MKHTLDSFVKTCQMCLKASSRNKNLELASGYLEGTRNLSKETLNCHRIGYCPKDLSVPKEICYFGEEDNQWSGLKYIRGKVIVPLFSEFGRIEGFATRTPSSEKGNTWWNSPYPFEKSNHLYLLDKARKEMFNKNKIYLVEGYVDGIMLYQEGLKNVCSLMGTALSIRQVGLIARYCNNVCLCMDMDENCSGQNAQEKSIYILSEFGFFDNISVIRNLPIGQDPDSFVKKNGLKSLLDMEEVLSNKEISKISKKVRYLNGK